ncbi:hypothetical protein HRF69_24665, partial [Bacillus circulans]|uniref:capsular polysaccharide export protein, LipB/KpsS family n=1 Tax=Niallia circulans TaxID=1397 RepID=UPI001560DF6E|nr:hypothetical protein [Niallia circulans]
MDKAIFVQAHEKDKNVYFSSLSNYLQQKNTISGDHLVFNSIEERIYKDLDILNIIYLPKELQIMSDELTKDLKSKYDIDKIVHFTKIFNYSNGYDFDINKYSKLVIKFINYLYKYKSKNQLKLIITWNETFLFDKAAIEFAKVENIPYMLFEEGLFRPNTITVDTKGINYGNSVPNDVQFYKEKIFIKKDNNKQTEKLNSDKKIFEFPIYYFKELVKDYININIKKCELNLELKNKPFIAKINDKFKRFTYRFEKDEDIILPSNFIFVPFQVHDDSQIILNSPNIRNMEEMVNHIFSSVNK